MVKQKQRDIVWNVVKYIYQHSEYISSDKAKRNEFVNLCFDKLRDKRGSDVRIFEAYARPFIFGKNAESQILIQIKENIEVKMAEDDNQSIFKDKSNLYKSSLTRWLKAHCSAL